MKNACLIRALQHKLCTILWDDGHFLVTADHALLVRKHMSQTWSVIDACRIQPGDELLVYYSIAGALTASVKPVVQVEEDVRQQDVVEITMTNPAETLLVSSSGEVGPYVAVFGKQPDQPWSSDIWVMLLSRMPQALDTALQAKGSLQTCSLVLFGRWKSKTNENCLRFGLVSPIVSPEPCTTSRDAELLFPLGLEPTSWPGIRSSAEQASKAWHLYMASKCFQHFNLF